MEVPKPVSVVHFVSPPRHTSHDISEDFHLCIFYQNGNYMNIPPPASRIPLYISAHKVLATSHAGKVAGVDILQHSVHASQSSQDNELTSGRPEQVVGCLSLILLQENGVLAWL